MSLPTEEADNRTLKNLHFKSFIRNPGFEKRVWLANWLLSDGCSPLASFSFNCWSFLTSTGTYRPWWRSSGQRPTLLLWKSELESCWCLEFLCKKSMKRTKINEKEAGWGPTRGSRMVYLRDYKYHWSKLAMETVWDLTKKWGIIEFVDVIIDI